MTYTPEVLPTNVIGGRVIHNQKRILATVRLSLVEPREEPNFAYITDTHFPQAVWQMYLNATTRDCICGKLPTNVCGGCGVAKYCSKECQMRDWNNHKAACRTE